MRAILLFIFIQCTAFASSYGQATCHIHKIVRSVDINGKPDDEVWNALPMVNHFTENFPTDTAKAKFDTDVKMCYDHKNIYVLAYMHDTTKKDFVIQSYKRDFSIKNTDAFVLSISPLNDKMNGFSFGSSPVGAQREGLIALSGAGGVTTAWDNKWFCETSRDANGWYAEYKIPFKTLRFKKGSNDWGINFARFDLKNNENSTWVKVPLNFNLSHLGFMGNLHFDEPVKKSGANIVFIPYVTGGASFNYLIAPNPKIKNLASAGFDAKLGVTSSLNLDLTVNPDFSQVEVDDQVVNLDRFELFFPEKRQFFIENSDLFDAFGFSKIRPFFSRRIGLYKGVNIPIISAARLSGSINRNWRIGLMDMVTNQQSDLKLPTQNYVVFAIQRRVFDRSNIGLIAVAKQSFKTGESINKQSNTLIGADYNIYSKNNKWQGKIFYHHTFNQKANIDANANATWLQYNTSRINISWNHEYVGKLYNAEVGFVPRIGYFRLEPYASYTHYPKNKKVFSMVASIYYSQYWSMFTKQSTDRLNRFTYTLNFKSSAVFAVSVSDVQTRLLNTFNISGKNKYNIAAGNYNYRFANFSFNSNFRKKIYGGLSANVGSYFERYRIGYGASISFRFQPYGSISFSVDRNELLKKDQNIHLTLLGSRLDFTFSRNVFFSNLLQYNTQQNLFNINTRLQWRFKPMSDLYIVYTDIYDAMFGKRVRAFQIKLTYWFNL